MTTDDLEAFAQAFNRHDLDAIMAMMTDDCVFESSAGPEQSGKRHSGQAAVRAAFDFPGSAPRRRRRFPHCQLDRQLPLDGRDFLAE